MKDTREIADEIIRKLSEKDVKILMYHSYAYDSIYLKFEYGVANSLRIADHESKKKHLSYRYNLLLDIKETYIDTDGEYPKYYFGPDHVDELVQHVIDNVEEKKEKYGLKYATIMDMNVQKNKDNRFWKKAKEVGT